MTGYAWPLNKAVHSKLQRALAERRKKKKKEGRSRTISEHLSQIKRRLLPDLIKPNGCVLCGKGYEREDIANTLFGKCIDRDIVEPTYDRH